MAAAVAMIEQGAPHIIHSEEQLVAYTAELEDLSALESPSPSEIEAIELLSLLIEKYEDEHYPIPKASAVSVVRFLLDQHGLKQRDLADIFGGEPQVSMFLSGRRNLTVTQIVGLAERFHVGTDVFMPR